MLLPGSLHGEAAAVLRELRGWQRVWHCRAGCETLPGRGAALRRLIGAGSGERTGQRHPRLALPCPALPCPASDLRPRSRRKGGQVLLWGRQEMLGRTVQLTLISPGVGNEPKKKKKKHRERSSGKAGHIPVKNRPATTCSKKGMGVI